MAIAERKKTSIEPAKAPAAEPPVVLFDAVAATYGGFVALEDISLRIERGGITAVLGPSGAGKTTLLRLILGLQEPSRGIIKVLGTSPGRARNKTAFVPQIEKIDWNFPVSVAQVIAMGFNKSRPPWITRAERARIAKICEELGLAGLEGRQIGQLSGGQQQRVFLARALATKPELLVLDEPTSSTDVGTKGGIMELLSRLGENGITVVMATHDINSVANRATSVVLLNRRVIASGPPYEVLTPDLLTTTFGKPILTLEHEGQLLIAEVPQEAAHRHHIHVHHEHPPEDHHEDFPNKVGEELA
jgi:ABC-type Mn2+/Zn2+ transport system ATPase subunit